MSANLGVSFKVARICVVVNTIKMSEESAECQETLYDLTELRGQA